ncbi:MAG: hypothetical protein BroJett018_03130 [Chloroflexota bacterium]|nr:hypothetical protein [Chloroflexota bacterium]NOG61892.1 hypothetical protein [Chloroflexota bacterium]GIK62519.1 MAG: hypothetical protein BroJett018_03130 [Chloroflexota bacterium]
MTINIRQEIHKAVDDLPDQHLSDVLHLIELLIQHADQADVEPEEMWLLTSGNLKKMVDEMESAPIPTEDWRKHLHDI